MLIFSTATTLHIYRRSVIDRTSPSSFTNLGYLADEKSAATVGPSDTSLKNELSKVGLQ